MVTLQIFDEQNSRNKVLMWIELIPCNIVKYYYQFFVVSNEQMWLNNEIDLGDILEPSRLVLALYPHFCIFLLSLCTHNFWSSLLGASISSSLADVGSLCSLHGAIASSLRSRCSLWTLILQPITKVKCIQSRAIDIVDIFSSGSTYFYTLALAEV